MEVKEVNGVGFKPTNGDGIGTQSLAETFDTFLALLTTQLKNQDPLDPMQSEEFTQQLVQFSGVEQAIATNKKLDQLLDLQAANQLDNAVSYVGKTVEFVSDQMVLENGQAEFSYGLDGNAAMTTISIVDGTGRVVRTINGETATGRHTFVWDGLDGNGAVVPDGVYNFNVKAVTADDTTIDTVTAATGKVTGIEIVDGVATLTVGPIGGIAFDQLFAVRET